MTKSIAHIFLAISLTIGLSTVSLAEDFHNTRIVSSVSVINNYNGSYMCLDVARADTREGTPIVQYACHSGDNQIFSVLSTGIYREPTYIIQSKLNPRMCVGISNNSYANSTELLRLIPCIDNISKSHGIVYQRGAKWFMDSIWGRAMFRAYLKSIDNKDTCMDVPSGLLSNSLWIQVYYCNTLNNSGFNQTWYFLPPA